VIFTIGQIYEKQNRMIEANQYFNEALGLLAKCQRKERLYALVL